MLPNFVWSQCRTAPLRVSCPLHCACQALMSRAVGSESQKQWWLSDTLVLTCELHGEAVSCLSSPPACYNHSWVALPALPRLPILRPAIDPPLTAVINLNFGQEFFFSKEAFNSFFLHALKPVLRKFQGVRGPQRVLAWMNWRHHMGVNSFSFDFALSALTANYAMLLAVDCNQTRPVPTYWCRFSDNTCFAFNYLRGSAEVSITAGCWEAQDVPALLSS